MVNRDRCDLFRAVLCLLAKGPKSRVDIAFGCRFSNDQGKTMMSDLLTLKLMDEVDVEYARSQHYDITSKGKELLAILEELNSMVAIDKALWVDDNKKKIRLMRLRRSF